jgi:hypothetical protein
MERRKTKVGRIEGFGKRKKYASHISIYIGMRDVYKCCYIRRGNWTLSWRNIGRIKWLMLKSSEGYGSYSGDFEIINGIPGNISILEKGPFRGGMIKECSRQEIYSQESALLFIKSPPFRDCV